MLSIKNTPNSDELVVVLPGVGTYELYHGWSSGAETWIDGKIVCPNGRPRLQLDIACTGDESIVGTPAQEAAEALWAVGSVYSTPPENGSVLTLVVPGAALCNDTVLAVLRRFRP
jgi:hypothetical protein